MYGRKRVIAIVVVVLTMASVGNIVLGMTLPPTFPKLRCGTADAVDVSTIDSISLGLLSSMNVPNGNSVQGGHPTAFASLLALNEINSNPTLLPNIPMRIIINDTRSDPGRCEKTKLKVCMPISMCPNCMKRIPSLSISCCPVAFSFSCPGLTVHLAYHQIVERNVVGILGEYNSALSQVSI